MARGFGKLKTLVNEVPQGCIVDTDWLERNGIGHRNARYYADNYWLERIARGVYRRPFAGSDPGVSVGWENVLRSLHWLMGHEFHVGGDSALRHHGFNYDMPVRATPRVDVFGERLPRWIDRIPCATRLRHKQATLLDAPVNAWCTRATPGGDTVQDRWPLWFASPERALLEALADVPGSLDFHRVDKVVGGMYWLTGDNFNDMLQACTSYKVRRLFCAFAERHAHGWWANIDVDSIDLGRGVSALVRHGGKRHPRYQVVIPEEYVGRERHYLLNPGEKY